MQLGGTHTNAVATHFISCYRDDTNPDTNFKPALLKRMQHMFSDEYRKKLAAGKYTKWAVHLNEDTLQALLWAVGEYGVRATTILEILKERQQTMPEPGVVFLRAKVGLEMAARLVQGETLSVDDVTQSIADTTDHLRGHINPTDHLRS